MVKIIRKDQSRHTKVILDSVNSPVTIPCSTSFPDPKHSPHGLDLFPAEGSRLGRAGPRAGTCKVWMWASPRGSSCSTFPLTSRARRLRRPLTLPGSSLSLFPAGTEKPVRTMEPSQNSSQQAHLLQLQSITTHRTH